MADFNTSKAKQTYRAAALPARGTSRRDRQAVPPPTRALRGSKSITHLLHLLFKCREHFTAFGKGVLEFFKLLCVESQLQGERGLRLLAAHHGTS